MIVPVILTCLVVTVSTIPVTPDTVGLAQQTHIPAPQNSLPPAVQEASSQKPAAPQILVQIQPSVQQQQQPPPAAAPVLPLLPGGGIQQQGGVGPQGGQPQFLLPLPHHQPWVPQHGGGGFQLLMPHYQPNFQGPPAHGNLPTTTQQQQQQQQQQQHPMVFSPYGYYPVFSPPQGNQLYNPYGFPMVFQSPQGPPPQGPPSQPAGGPLAPAPAETPSGGPTGGAAAAANTHQLPERQQTHHQILYMFQQPMTSQFGGLSSEELEVAARLSQVGMFLPNAAAAAVNLPSSGRPSLGLPAAAGLQPSEAAAGTPRPAQPFPAAHGGVSAPEGNNAAPAGLVESSGQNPLMASLPGDALHQTNGRSSSSSSSSRPPGGLFGASAPPLLADALPVATSTAAVAVEVNDIYHP